MCRWLSNISVMLILLAACQSEESQLKVEVVETKNEKLNNFDDVDNVDKKEKYPSPFWSVQDAKPPVKSTKNEEFNVVIRNVSVSGECAGEGGKKPSSGIYLTIKGEVKNTLSEQIHKATLTGIAYFKFSDNVSISKASGEFGFDQEITSDNSWKPNAYRSFEVTTRPLDPIYCEYKPLEAIAGLNLYIETPLGEILDRVIFSGDFLWDMINGQYVNQSVVLNDNVKAYSSFYSTSLIKSEKVSVFYIKREKALIGVSGVLYGWVPISKLDFEVLPEKSKKKNIFKIENKKGYTVELFSILENENIDIIVTVKNVSDKKLSMSPGNILMEFSNGKLKQGSPEQTFLDICKSGLEPNTEINGKITFQMESNSYPILLGERGSNPVLIYNFK